MSYWTDDDADAAAADASGVAAFVQAAIRSHLSRLVLFLYVQLSNRLITAKR